MKSQHGSPKTVENSGGGVLGTKTLDKWTSSEIAEEQCTQNLEHEHFVVEQFRRQQVGPFSWKHAKNAHV